MIKFFPFKLLRNLLEVMEKTEFARVGVDLNEGEIEAEGFASTTTLNGLSVTIRSTIDIVDFLLYEAKYNYVLTGKLNQDCIEVCGCNRLGRHV